MSDQNETAIDETIVEGLPDQETRDPGFLEDAAAEDDARDDFFLPGGMPSDVEKIEDPSWGPNTYDGVVDVQDLLRAQNEFIHEQTAFLTAGFLQIPTQENLVKLTRYSRAQGRFIQAQAEVLRQLKVV